MGYQPGPCQTYGAVRRAAHFASKSVSWILEPMVYRRCSRSISAISSQGIKARSHHQFSSSSYRIFSPGTTSCPLHRYPGSRTQTAHPRCFYLYIRCPARHCVTARCFWYTRWPSASFILGQNIHFLHDYKTTFIVALPIELDTKEKKDTNSKSLKRLYQTNFQGFLLELLIRFENGRPAH